MNDVQRAIRRLREDGVTIEIHTGTQRRLTVHAPATDVIDGFTVDIQDGEEHTQTKIGGLALWRTPAEHDYHVVRD
jgi:hypothetical protein